MRLVACFAVFFCLVLPAQAVDKARTWTDIQGRTMRAEFVREVDGDATFLKDGKLLTLPLDRLIEADRKVIGELEAGKTVEEEATPAGAPTSDLLAPALPSASVGGNDLVGRPPLAKKQMPLENRVWTDTQGNKMTAKFVRMNGSDVVLLRGARAVTLPLDSLVGADQAYIREVLTARGEQASIPSSIANADEPSAVAPPAFAEPPTPSAPTPSQPPAVGPEPTVARGNSDLFDKLRQRDAESRQDQAQHAAQVGPQQHGDQQQPSESPEENQQPVAVAEAGSPSSGESTSGNGLRTSQPPLDRQTAREFRGAAIVVAVAAGVLATVGIIVWVAIAIASTNTARRQREYS